MRKTNIAFMNLGSIIQISGILITTIGTIFALAKLWQKYFHKIKKLGELDAWLFKDYIKYNHLVREEEKKYLKKVLKSEEYEPRYRQLLNKLIEAMDISSDRNINRVSKKILRKIFIDRYFLYVGISLIVIGAIIQIIGIILE